MQSPPTTGALLCPYCKVSVECLMSQQQSLIWVCQVNNEPDGGQPWIETLGRPSLILVGGSTDALTTSRFPVEGDASICSSCSKALVPANLPKPLHAPQRLLGFCMCSDASSLINRPHLGFPVKRPTKNDQNNEGKW